MPRGFKLTVRVPISRVYIFATCEDCNYSSVTVATPRKIEENRERMICVLISDRRKEVRRHDCISIFLELVGNKRNDRVILSLLAANANNTWTITASIALEKQHRVG